MSSFQTDLLYQKRLDISAVLTISSSGMWTSGLSLAVLRVPASVLYQLRSCEAPSSLGVRLSPLILPCRGADMTRSFHRVCASAPLFYLLGAQICQQPLAQLCASTPSLCPVGAQICQQPLTRLCASTLSFSLAKAQICQQPLT